MYFCNRIGIILNDSDSEYHENGKQKYVETFQAKQQTEKKNLNCNTLQQRVI